MKIIIPMAGHGSRFSDAGFRDPKPFINIYGKAMIRSVVDNLNLHQHEHIFMCRESHLKNFSMNDIFSDIKFQVVPIKSVTDGAAITVSMAKHLFQTDEDIMIVNSDQLVHYNSTEVEEVRQSDVDGCLWCFNGNGPKWSYVKLSNDGYVVQVAEKEQISNIATGGMYYWRSFYNFLDCSKKMIDSNDRVNNEFYVAPVYNYAMGQKVIIKMLNDIDQLGTPEDLREYENKVRLY